MADFDPYRKWLGIPPEEQPPNHYRLLGIGLFESDTDVISNAADRQMAHVRTFQSGEHSDLSQRILNELAAARVCLLNTQKKDEYDDLLRRELPAEKPGPPPPQIATPPQPPPGGSAPPVSAPPPAPPVPGGSHTFPNATRPNSYTKRRRTSSWWASVIALAVVIVSLTLLAWALKDSGAEQPRKPGVSSGKRNGDASSRGQNSRRKPGRTSEVRGGPGRPSRRRVGVPAPQGHGRTNGSGNGSSAGSDDGGRAGQSGTADRQPHGAAGTGSSPPTGGPVDPQHPKPNGQELEFERTPVPDAAELQQIEKLIRGGDLQEDFEAADAPQGRLALARRLLAEGRKPQDDVASGYVLLRLARDEATGLGEAGTALAAVDEIGRRYEIDVLGEKVKTLEAASKATAAPAQRRTLLEKTLGVTEEAAAAGHFQAAERLLRIARFTAPRVREGVLARGELSKLVKARAAKIDKLKENRQPGQPASKGPGEVFDPRVLPVFGSSDASEAAVDRALKWLAEHQQADGSWSFDHTGPPCKKRCPNRGTLAAAPNAATALALLPFLAAGNGPRQGEFRDNVAAGLSFLKSRLNPLGPTVATLYEPRAGQMRPHALGTIALCEASAVSPDRQTRKAAQSAVNCIVASQNADGGWPPQPQLPAQQSGPSSIEPTGWNLAALRTAQWAGLQVPRKTLKQARAYLEGMRTEDKTGYRPDEDSAGRDGTATAIAVLCQMYLGWPHEEKELVDYVATLGKPGPSTAGQFYLNYYTSQVMRHHGGAAWDAWNAALRDQLVASQASDGHTAGSWHVPGIHWSNRQGGRLFCTALAALMLEVSYRHPPLYH